MFFSTSTSTTMAMSFAMEREVSSFLSPPPDSYSSSSSEDDYTLWLWMSLKLLGCYSVVSLCSNAVACYQFFSAWNSIHQTYQMDRKIRNLCKHNSMARRIQMDQALVTKKYGQTTENGSTCSICLADFHYHDPVSSASSCGHLFHQDCIRAWLDKHPSCPYCRTNILPDDETNISHPLLLQ